MPSSAFKHFRVNIIDVRRLSRSHNELTPNHRGRRALGHITRSGIVMLCACWELYVENVLVEASKYLASGFSSPDNLPKTVRKHISHSVKIAKHELEPLKLAGDGWREMYGIYCHSDTQALNTPKYSQLKKLFNNYIGLEDIATIWNISTDDIDDFVSLRGKIAHRGRSAPYVTIIELNSHLEIIYNNCKHMDNQLCSYLHRLIGGNVQPWRKLSR